MININNTYDFGENYIIKINGVDFSTNLETSTYKLDTYDIVTDDTGWNNSGSYNIEYIAKDIPKLYCKWVGTDIYINKILDAIKDGVFNIDAQYQGKKYNFSAYRGDRSHNIIIRTTNNNGFSELTFNIIGMEGTDKNV